jgi:hypothetical protein
MKKAISIIIGLFISITALTQTLTFDSHSFILLTPTSKVTVSDKNYFRFDLDQKNIGYANSEKHEFYVIDEEYHEFPDNNTSIHTIYATSLTSGDEIVFEISFKYKEGTLVLSQVMESGYIIFTDYKK